MQGADKYMRLFRTGQHGKLYLVCGSHARGDTFSIYVMPTDEPHSGMPWTCKDAVEVYGICGGQPGWTEWYGWLHDGPWQQDFAELVTKREAEVAAHKEAQENERIAATNAEAARKAELLRKYVP